MKLKNSFFKKMISTLFKENENLKKENEVLKNVVCVLEEKVKENSFSNGSSKEKQILNKKVKHLETTLFRCVNRKEKFDAIIEK